MKKILYVLPMLLSGYLFAQPGSLDNNFGNGGIAPSVFTNTNNNYGRSLFLQSDGKILNCGSLSSNGGPDDIYMLRYLTDGTLDSSFGTNGQVSGPIGPGNDDARDVIQQNDKKILLVGGYENPSQEEVFIRRYDSTGVLDTTFASGGMVSTDFQPGYFDEPNQARLQPDGKIVIFGTTYNPITYDVQMFLMRYLSDGTLDSAFGTGGKVLFNNLTGKNFASRFVLQPDGKIVVVATNDNAVTNDDLLVVRYLINGSIDSTFNADGIYTYDFAGDDDEGWAIALQPDGKILVGGLASINTGDDYLIRLDTSGYPDTTFNSTGILLADHNLGWDNVYNILVQGDGKIITISESFGSTIPLVVSRYMPNGMLDNSFGNGGTITHLLNSYDTFSSAALLQPDNKILFTGDNQIQNQVTTNLTVRLVNDTLTTRVAEEINAGNRIFPQPATDKIYISDLKAGSMVTIYDSRGSIVDHKLFDGVSIDVRNFEEGIYFLKQDDGRGERMIRFVKM